MFMMLFNALSVDFLKYDFLRLCSIFVVAAACVVVVPTAEKCQIRDFFTNLGCLTINIIY